MLAVSVDPARDTSRAARAYVREHRLDSDFHYLLGSRTQLEPVLQAYNVLAVARNPELVDHSAFVLLIDRRGEPKLFYPPTVQADTILHDLLIGVLGGAADAH